MFDDFYIPDFSAPSPARPARHALWLAHTRAGEPATPPPAYFRTPAALADHLAERLAATLDAGRRVLLGVDFSLGYPRGFAAAVLRCGSTPAASEPP